MAGSIAARESRAIVRPSSGSLTGRSPPSSRPAPQGRSQGQSEP
ncbi:hypothetical protein [Oxynema aestuarii]|nr:hypothetical protein [Oxynema aestuarii]